MRAELQTLHANIETVSNARRQWSTRSSVRLILDDEEGHVGLGEAAPLAGCSAETASEARDALAAVRWPARAPATLAEVQAVVERIDRRLPSARFAAETALASMAALVQGVPLWALWVGRMPNDLAVEATLFADDLDSLRGALLEAVAFDAEVVKLEIGRTDRKSERAMLRLVRERLPNAELRLDASGALARDSLFERIDELRPFAPAFLEEPMLLSAVLALDEPLPFALAVDESLSPDPEDTLAQALRSDAIGVVVLKPTLLGGLSRCWTLAARARAAGRSVVVSHLLEGTVARAAAAHLALALGGEAAGLGEHPALDPLSAGLIASWIDYSHIEPPEVSGLGLDVEW